MEEMNIDLSKLFQIIKKNIFLIIITTLICGLITAAFSKFVITPKYTSSISVYLSNDISTASVNEDYQGVMLNQKLVQTYDEFIKTRRVAQDVVNELNLKEDASAVQKMISLKSLGESQFIKITITNEDPVKAYEIANQVVLSLKKISTEIRGEDNIKLVDAATQPVRPSSPNILKNTLVGMLLGIFLALSFLLIKNALDTTVKKPEFIEDELGLAVLGTIPKIAKKA